MVLQVLHEIIQPEETSNYDHPDNKPTKNNHVHIKNSKYSMLLLTESQRKIFLENLADPLAQNDTRNSLSCMII